MGGGGGLKGLWKGGGGMERVAKKIIPGFAYLSWQHLARRLDRVVKTGGGGGVSHHDGIYL